MFDGMLGKLQAMQGQVEEIKKRLETVIVEGSAEGIVVKINGNRKIQDIHIPEDLLGDKEALEDILILATNRAIEQANNLHDTEMASQARNMLPGLG